MPYQPYWEEENTSAQHQSGEVAVRSSLYVNEETGRSALIVQPDPVDQKRCNEATPQFAREVAEKANLDFGKMEVYQTNDFQSFVQRDRDTLGQSSDRENLNDPGREREQVFTHEGLDRKLDGCLSRDPHDLSKESITNQEVEQQRQQHHKR
jgi:hypothetical protein